MEKTALEKTPWLKFRNDILNEQPKEVDLNQVSDFQFLYPQKTRKSILDFVLSAEWTKWNTATTGNILIVGRTGCSKTTFVQNLGKNKLFGDISKMFWVSKIALSEEREDAIRDSFDEQEVHFSCP